MKMLTPPIDAQKAMHIALGAASPLWLLYASAGAAGAGWFWMTRWQTATNLEAVLGALKDQTDAAAMKTVAVVEADSAATASTVALVEAVPEPVAEVVAAPMPEPVAELDPDDLTVLVGIGPKLAASLAERGITRYADVAALTPKRIARLNDEMKLMGRIDRDAWVAQAKRLVQ